MPERRKIPGNEKQIWFQRDSEPHGNLVSCSRVSKERRGPYNSLVNAQNIAAPYISNINDLNQFGSNMQAMMGTINTLIYAVQSLYQVIERRK